jgi:hypothetical protein
MKRIFSLGGDLKRIIFSFGLPGDFCPDKVDIHE